MAHADASGAVPDDYDEYTVGDVEAFVASVADPARLDAIAAYEADHKDRKTAHEAIEARADALAEHGAATGASHLQTTHNGLPVDAEAVLPDDDPRRHTGADGEERLLVRNPATGGRQVAGLSFAAGEVKEVAATPAVEYALRHGGLQFVSHRTPDSNSNGEG